MLLEQFQQHLKNHFLLQPQQVKFVVAVSGGIDSTVLTDLIDKSGYDFLIAHCNFLLRGEESDRDELFVRYLGEKYGKPVFVKRFDTKSYANTNKLSIQEAARELRYSWFAELVRGEWRAANGQPPGLHDDAVIPKHFPVAANLPPLTLLTAHNANDNIETMMMHFFRGTGIHGLTGIPEKDAARNILRPLLFAKREAIAAYAQENNLKWAEDSSNAKDLYTRNFFRLQVLPMVKETFANAEDNLLHNIHRFKETEILYRQSVQLHKQKLLEQKGNEWHIPVLKLQKTIPLHTIAWEIIKDFGFSAAQTAETLKLLQAGNGSYITGGTHRIIRNRSWLIIAPLQTGTAGHILVEEKDKKIHFEQGELAVKMLQALNYKPTGDNNIACLDAAHIQFPLLLRKWKQGDYFYPLGMSKKKKLSKFFIDLKLSKTAKENVWVVECDKKIIWVIGYRIDNRFKITAHTKSLLQLQLKPADK